MYCGTIYRATTENNKGQSGSVTTGRRLMLPPGSLQRSSQIVDTYVLYSFCEYA